MLTEEKRDKLRRKLLDGKQDVDGETARELLDIIDMLKAEITQFDQVVATLTKTVEELLKLYHGRGIGDPKYHIHDMALFRQMEMSLSALQSVRLWRNNRPQGLA